MKLCPIAIATGCKKCPLFKPCPLKSVIGDYDPNQTCDTKQSESEAVSGDKSSKAKVD